MENIYARAAADLIHRFPRVEVLRYRLSMTGRASLNGIEAPMPKSELSFAIFAHEMAHIVLRHVVEEDKTARWKEELDAWNFALEQLRHYSFRISKRVKRHMTQSLSYALAKALNRGMKSAPPELRKYMKYLDKCTGSGIKYPDEPFIYITYRVNVRMIDREFSD